MQIVSQLRCAGLIEAIRISRSAYPYRVTHFDFLVRFGKLRPRLIPKLRTMVPAEQCALLLSDIWPNQYYLGPKAGKSGADLGGSNKAYELGFTRVSQL